MNLRIHQKPKLPKTTRNDLIKTIIINIPHINNEKVQKQLFNLNINWPHPQSNKIYKIKYENFYIRIDGSGIMRVGNIQDMQDFNKYKRINYKELNL